MLDANPKTQLKAYMENIRRPVELVAALDDSKGSRDLEELLQEISDLSDKVGWTRQNGAPPQYQPAAAPRNHAWIIF